MFVLMAAAESAPFARSGGLGDVVGALPRFLKRRGIDVAVVLPGHRCLRRSEFRWEGTDYEVEVPIAEEWVRAPVWRTTTSEFVPVYAIMADRYFDRKELYGEGNVPYGDNAERFAFFCRAVLDLVRLLGVPDIIHVHDWHAALVPAFLKADPGRYEWSPQVRTVLTIHNLAYQGVFPPEQWRLLCLDSKFFSFDAFEAWVNINYLKAGISFADWITTVSPTYAREIQTPEHGFGLDAALRYRSRHLSGILNGVDPEVWDPASDPQIAARYSANDLTGKTACKLALQASFGLKNDPLVPLAGVVSRLVVEKGMDLLADVVPTLVDKGIQLVVLGRGDPALEAKWAALVREFQGRIALSLSFDDGLARRIYAGSDLFLMPSRFEPCGLAQMYAMRYGSIPVVHRTGGLADSVIDADADPERGTGFHFEPFAAEAFVAAVDRALTLYRQPQAWRQLVAKAMQVDFSWHRAAADYEGVYRLVLDSPPFE
ncbi:Glycogen synthase [bacterium HR30]|nr:Glycogen synthase [bacterium HR30]